MNKDSGTETGIYKRKRVKKKKTCSQASVGLKESVTHPQPKCKYKPKETNEKKHNKKCPGHPLPTPFIK